MAKKSAYLNKNFFYVRALLYFLIWAVLARAPLRLLGAAGHLEGSEAHGRARRASRRPATFLFALSLTFAAFDWIMSLEPTWFSTIFGVYYFADRRRLEPRGHHPRDDGAAQRRARSRARSRRSTTTTSGS